MVHLLKLLFLSAFTWLMFGLSSCDKDEHKVFYEGGTPPQLSGSLPSGAVLPMSYTTSNEEAVKLMWTNPNYQFNTGVSSHDVTYYIDIDTAGSQFTNPSMQTLSVSKDLSKSFTQAELNGYLLNQLQLAVSMPHTIEMRVRSVLRNNTVPLVSNVLQYVVTPYAIPPKITPPASGTLYITGSATAGGWMGSGDPELLSQKFTQVSPTLYEITIDLIGNGSYTFVPVYGDWSKKYSIKVKNDPALIYGGDFQEGGEDILAPPVSGTYKITVDFQRGKFIVTKL